MGKEVKIGFFGKKNNEKGEDVKGSKKGKIKKVKKKKRSEQEQKEAGGWNWD